MFFFLGSLWFFSTNNLPQVPAQLGVLQCSQPRHPRDDGLDQCPGRLGGGTGKVYPTGHQDMPRGTMDIDGEFIIVYPNLMSDDSILFFAQILEIPTVSWLLGIKNSYSQPENMG